MIRYGLAELLILQLTINIFDKEHNPLIWQGLRFYLITTFVCKGGVGVGWRVNIFSAKNL